MRGEERHKLETDALILRVERAVDWAQENRRSLVTIIAATVGVALLLGAFPGEPREPQGGGAYPARRPHDRNPAGHRGAGGPAGAVRGFASPSWNGWRRVRATRSKAEPRATTRGFANGRSGTTTPAAASFEQVRGRNDLLAELATLSLAGVQRTSGKGEEAALAYRSLLDGSGDLPLDPVLFELGVLEEEQGRPEAAVALYERIVEEYPASAFRDLAETRRERLPDPSR